MLAHQGHTILHLTRHCGMEHGKDVITTDGEGMVCAFQLKKADGKIKLSKWQNELLGQVMQLVYSPVAHPSVKDYSSHHHSYFVTNGEFEEEVFREIDLLNKDWVFKGQPQYKINTIVKGQLLNWANELKTDLLPTEIRDFKLLLEFYLASGQGILDREKFARLLDSHFERKTKSASQSRRIISSGALLCCIATSTFTNHENHIATAEAWIMFTSYLMKFCEVNKLTLPAYRNELEICRQIITNSIKNSFEEAASARHLVVGNPFHDVFVYKPRVTYLIGFYAGLALHELITASSDASVLQSIRSFIEKHDDDIELWGESAVPCCLNYYWLQKTSLQENRSKHLLRSITGTVIHSHRDRKSVFPDPYYDIDEALSAGFEENEEKKAGKSRKGFSYYLESLLMLCVKENDREFVASEWFDITKIFFSTFELLVQEDFFSFRCAEGKEVFKTPVQTESWHRLQKMAHEDFQDSGLCEIFKNNRWFYPFFFLLFPHRVSTACTLWFDRQFPASADLAE